MGFLRWVRENLLCRQDMYVEEVVDDLEETLEALDDADSEMVREELISQMKERMEAIRESVRSYHDV